MSAHRHALSPPLAILCLLLPLSSCDDKSSEGEDTSGSDTEDTSDTQDSEDTNDSDTAEDTSAPREDRFFPDGAPWYQDISAAPIDPSSELLITALQAHGWGLGRFQIDFSFEVLEADKSDPIREFTPTDDFYSPDCDHLPVPVPEDGALEGETGLACTSGGDCHLLVVARQELGLYEMWRANITGEGKGVFDGGCLVRWDMGRLYPESGRGDQCTSADAAGYPITPLLFTADELAAGEIDHAIRFILPNDIIRDGVFYHPATHATNAEGGGDEAIPYGAHLRLRADFDMDRLKSEHARTVARALQRYGMFLADGGNVALTARSDRSTSTTWKELGFDSHALVEIEPQDFELLELPEPIPLTFECERNP